jgi:hypothetical protein
MECHYILRSFGISDKLTPVGFDGELSVEHHLNFLAVREPQEHAREAELLSSTPANHIVLGPFDVLSGSRGRLVQEHAGNKRYLHLVEFFQVRYEEVSKFEKTVFAQTVLGMIKEPGGRFLKHDKNASDGWKEINDDEAHAKISHAFRNRRRGSGIGGNKKRATVGASTTSIMHRIEPLLWERASSGVDTIANTVHVLTTTAVAREQ